jgi:hypothetical protein
MININDVIPVTALLGNYSDEELEKYAALIENAVSVASSMLKDESMSKESKAIYLASAKANYDMALAMTGGDNVTSFKAGDVSISECSAFVENAKAIFEEAKVHCASLIKDECFAFLGV